MNDIFTIFCAYVLGSIPFGLLVTWVMTGQDVRALGSGNIGATNVLRTGNKAAAALTLLLDGLKGFVAVWVAAQWTHSPELALLAAIAALVGHCYPVWLRFKGGKGVATGLGVHLALAWPVGLAMLGMWLFMAWWRKYSSLAALTAFALSPVLAYALYHDSAYAFTAAVMSGLIGHRHRDNIRRLINGTEGKIGK